MFKFLFDSNDKQVNTLKVIVDKINTFEKAMDKVIPDKKIAAPTIKAIRKIKERIDNKSSWVFSNELDKHRNN